MESLGLKSKNDHIDAKGLARMGCEQKLDEWSPLSPFYHKLRTYTRLHEDIQQKKTETINQLHALKHGAVQMTDAIEVLQRLVDCYDLTKPFFATNFSIGYATFPYLSTYFSCLLITATALNTILLLTALITDCSCFPSFTFFS